MLPPWDVAAVTRELSLGFGAVLAAATAVAEKAAAGATTSKESGGVVVTVVTGLFALGTAAYTAITTRRLGAQQHRYQVQTDDARAAQDIRLKELDEKHEIALKKFEAEQNKQIEDLKAMHAENASRLESELHVSEEVRKKEQSDYAAYAAALERMRAAAQVADERVQWLADRARDRSILGQLANNHYEWKSSIYDLVAPIALAGVVPDLAFRGVQRNQFLLARRLRDVLGAGAGLASQIGLAYSPGLAPAGDPKTKANFRIRDTQHVVRVGLLLGAFKSGKPGEPVADYDEFIARFSSEPGFDAKVADVGALLRRFEPRERPVFWLVLIAIVVISRALQTSGNAPDLHAFIRDFAMPREELGRYDWRASPGDPGDPDVFEQPFAAAKRWLLQTLPGPTGGPSPGG